MSSVLRENAGLLAGAGLATASMWWYWTRPSIPMPPGPMGNLIFGSALELAKSNAYWLDIARYADQYGPIFSLRMLFQRVVVINDPVIATNLFEGRATQYSDRHVSELAKLAGWDRDISFTPYGPRLKLYRGLLYRALNSRAALDYIPRQEHEIKRMLKKLSERPEDFIQHIYLMSATVALRVVYGYEVESPDDRFLKNAEQFIEVVSELLSPGKWMIEVFPILRYVPTWFPGATFHRVLESWKPIIHANQELGKAEPSFVSKLLQPEDGKEVTEEDEFYIKSIAGTLYGAATDTTVSLIKSFFLAVLLYPDVQAKAQAEIAAYLEKPEVDSAQSDRTLPISMADRQHLPYTNAIILETLRWHPVAALLVHRSYDQDDNNVIAYGKTYRIPARTNVLVNSWSILHDPRVYPEPEKFKPERYLVDNPPRSPDLFAFGLGRRMCPGIVVAQQLLWLSISNVLANFSILRTKDENGVEIIPEELYTSGMVCHPAPFKCNIQTLKSREKWISEIES